MNTKSFLDDVNEIVVPTMVIQNRNDPWTNIEMVEQYFDKLQVEKEMMWLEIEKNRFAAYDFVGCETAKIVPWFNKYLA